MPAGRSSQVAQVRWPLQAAGLLCGQNPEDSHPPRKEIDLYDIHCVNKPHAQAPNQEVSWRDLRLVMCVLDFVCAYLYGA